MASVSGTSSITIKGMTPPGWAGALVVALAVAVSAGGATWAEVSVTAGALVSAAGCAVASAAATVVADLALSSATGALVDTSGALVETTTSLVVLTLAVAPGSEAGALVWAMAAELQATSPPIVRMHSVSFICVKLFGRSADINQMLCLIEELSAVGVPRPNSLVFLHKRLRK